jgi:FkbM family methyltransferase
MRLRDAVIKLGQRLPLWVRQKIAASPFSFVIRRTLNQLFRDEIVLVSLSGPLQGHKMRLNWRHHKEYAFGVYEPAVVNAIQHIVKLGWVCADVGAHLGYITLLLAKSVGPTGKVVAFEPFPNNFQVLQSNIALNGYKNVVLENKAVMDQSGWVSLKPYGDDPLPYSTFAHSGSGGCAAVSLDDYWGNRTDRLNFVKIDVEGAEAAVLKGMERIMCRDRPILLVELHAFDQWGENHPALQIIRDFNYAVSYLGRRRGEMHILAQPKE